MTCLYIKATESHQDRSKYSGISEYAREHGWNLQSCEAINSAAEAKELLDLWNPDGVIMNLGFREAAETFFTRCPVLAFHQPREGCCDSISRILCNSSEAAALAAKELLSLDLASYTVVPFPGDLPWSDLRVAEFSRLMALHGRDYRDCTGLRSHAPATLAAFLKKMPKPVGIFAVNDRVAEKAVAACRLAGLSIPEDAAVIGVDDDPDRCENSSPTISSVHFDYRATGYLAAGTLERMIETQKRRPSRKPKPLTVTYDPSGVTRRESTRRFKVMDRTVLRAQEKIRLEACNGLRAGTVFGLFDCSRRMAEIRFRRTTGNTVLGEIRAVRLARARELLLNRTLDLGYIANACGYATLPAFSLFFKNETGETPSAWRKARFTAAP